MDDDSTFERFPTEEELTVLFPGYRDIRLLSQTSGSQIYLAEEEALQRDVVLKILHQQLAMDSAFRERFNREVMTAAHLEHPNIVPVYAAGESDGRLFLVMRFVEGSDLESVLRDQGQLSLDSTVHYVRQLASALDAAHRAGLVHRDVKPKNVLVDREQNHAYLCDFGIAKKVSAETIGTPGRFVGTAAYASPEQIRGEAVDRRTDVYALGGLVYRCLSGRTAFDGETPAVLWSHLNAPPPRLRAVRTDLDRRVDGVIAKAMAKRPRDRFATCGELADQLAAVATGVRGASTRRTGWWIGVAAGAVALAVLAAVTRPWQPATSPAVHPSVTASAPQRLEDFGASLYERPGDPVRLTVYQTFDTKVQRWISHPRTSLPGPFATAADAWQSMLSPDGAYLVDRLRERAPGDYEVLRITDKATGLAVKLRTVRSPRFTYLNAWSRDGRRLVVTVGQDIQGGWQTTGFAVIDPAKPSFAPVRLSGKPLKNTWYGFDPTGTAVVALSPDLGRQPLRFFSLAGEVRRRVEEVGAGLAGTMFSPSGKRFLTNCPGLTDADHCVYDLGSGKELRRLTSGCSDLARWFDDDHLVCRVILDEPAGISRYVVIDLTGTQVRTLADIPGNTENIALEFTPVIP